MRTRVSKNEIPFMYTIQNGCLMFKQWLVVPPQSKIVDKILLEFHASQIGGHSGVAKTIKRISKYFWWPKMNEAITKFVTNCVVY